MGVPGKKVDSNTQRRIKEERERYKLSIRNIARRNGVSPKTVQKYVREE